ncbi:MAG: hypothetical protein HOW73_40240 [Polyangiaceae bacterium]|nr:hypothetical protein [Polyangiaceae bacterium]
MMQTAAAMQVEKVLDDLILRLSKSDSTAEIKAALIEARRLRNVTMRWAAIPPPPDARREMLSRVMDLVAKAGPSAGSLRPMAEAEPSIPPEAAAHLRPTLTPPLGAPTKPPSSPRAGTPAALKFRTDTEAGLVTPDSMPPAKTLGGPRPPSSEKISAAPTAPPPPGHPAAADPIAAERFKRKVETLSYAGETQQRAGLRAPGQTSKFPAADAIEDLAFALSPPPPPRAVVGQRARTIAGIPEAHERRIDPSSSLPPNGVHETPAPPKRKISSASLDVQRLTGANAPAAPSARPPSTSSAPSVRPLPGSAPPGEQPRTSAPPPLRRTGQPRGTLMMGSLSVPDPIKAAIVDAAAESPSVASMLQREAQPATAQRPLRTVVAPGVTIVRPDASQWQPHPSAPGVTMKLLYRDPRSGVYTALVRIAAGASLPARRHAAPEEAMLVSGVAFFGEHEMRAGEYYRAESETIHDAITTSTGCTFFLCGSEHDEFLDQT